MNAATYSAHVAQKADRLLAEGKVREVPQARVFLVQGSSAEPYLVFIHAGVGTTFCPCPATVKCAHVVAAETLVAREAPAA